MTLRGYLRRLSGRLNPLSSPASEAAEEEREPVTSLPDGYKEATIEIGEVESPAMFDAPVPDIHCDLCGEPYPDYWVWFSHARDEHSFETIDEAQAFTTVIVPTGHDGEVETGASFEVDANDIVAELEGSDDR